MMTPREAARMLGISYPTIKHWILSGKLPTTQTLGGHHRVAETTLQPFLTQARAKAPAVSRERFRRINGRNQLPGKIVSIRVQRFLVEVVLAFESCHITAIITANAVQELQLLVGDTAAALIKSTDVMIERLDESIG